ncbi:MAG: hypothetical protein ACPGO5_02385 [Patescibacteria group bacterium]
MQKVGFIGQGWVGKHYADWFEKTGLYDIVRYDIDTYAENKDAIKDCEVVFVCVPTPTNDNGFDDSIVDSVLSLIGDGNTAVIKSTILPGTTSKMQKKHPNITVLFSPEFLREASAADDVANPERNVVGITDESQESIAEKVINIFPKAPFNKITTAETAELIKYASNCFLYMKVVFANILYDISEDLGISYDDVADIMVHDSRIGTSHLQVVHQGGRGAAGNCFAKDMEAFRELVEKHADEEAHDMIKSIIHKNLAVLEGSGKDTDLIKSIYKDI